MKSYEIPSESSTKEFCIETELKFTTKYGFEDRFYFRTFNGLIDDVSSMEHFAWALGDTFESVEEWVSRMEAGKIKRAEEKFLNFQQRMERAMQDLKQQEKKQRQYNEDHADEIYMDYVERINYTKN